MKTRSGIEYWIEDGKYIADYDYFDSLEELEEALYWESLWIDGKAYIDPITNEWRRDYEIGENKLLSILNELFGEPLTAGEFLSRIQLLGERERHLIEDKYLTEFEILEIEDRWGLFRSIK